MALPLRDRLVQLEQTLERLFGGQPPREPLEVRRAVVDGLLAQVTPVGRGRRVLPFSRVTVSILATDTAQRRLFKAALTGDQGVEADLRKGLERDGAEWPRGFALDVRFVREPGKAWAPGARFHVTVAGKDSPGEDEPVAAVAPAPAEAPVLVLRVLSGQARPKTVTIRGGRITLGRQTTVTDQQGSVVRRNDLAFVGEDEVSRSVSRAHGHVAWQPATRTYRVFDEHSSHGTRVARQGRLVPVPPGRDGLRLQPGDDLHLGQAIVRVELP
jgi:hypothetical protein